MRNESNAVGSILVVENDAEMLSAICQTLTESGYLVGTAQTVTSAIEALEQNPPSLVLLDWCLWSHHTPDQPSTGDSVLAHRNTRFPAIPVVVISGNPRIDARNHALRLGADSFIEKPFDPTTLPSHISRLLNRDPFRLPFNEIAGESIEILPLREVERRYARQVLDRLGGNQSSAAKALGIHRQTLAALVCDTTGALPVGSKHLRP